MANQTASRRAKSIPLGSAIFGTHTEILVEGNYLVLGDISFNYERQYYQDEDFFSLIISVIPLAFVNMTPMRFPQAERAMQT